MLDPKDTLPKARPFDRPEKFFDGLDAATVAHIATTACDVALVVDGKGKILDAAGNAEGFPDLDDWVGKSWSTSVTVESRPKIADMLDAAADGKRLGWRQVNHPGDEGDVPVRYLLVGLAKNRRLAIGRDMRDAAALQQKLIQAQQSLERDYLRLRQAETRYRLLFELSTEPMMIIEAETRRIREANAVACRLVGAEPGSLAGRRLSGLFRPGERDSLVEYLGKAPLTTTPSALPLELADERGEVALTASAFRQEGALFLLVRLYTPEASGTGHANGVPVRELVERLPDGFVIADADLDIVAANAAFLDLAQAASSEQLEGRPLGDFLGRPGIDLELIRSQLAKHGIARNVGTVVRSSAGDEEEAVEVSAVGAGEDEAYYAFAIRPVGRRLRDLPPSPQDLPRSVEQLTELVGRMSLKDIVRESTDLIERLCIEAALAYTSDNRASAAEILGLSRQSLYSKLHRYGLGNLAAEGD